MNGLLKKVTLLLLLLGFALPGVAATSVSVADLNHLLATTPRPADNQLATKLSGLELTQRLNSAELLHRLDEMPGQKSRQALLALADKSAFLELPPEEIPPNPVPDSAAQRRMLALSLEYINKTIRQLPNLFATRVTSSYQETLWEHWVPESGLIRYDPLHFVGRYSTDVQYRVGGEEAHINLPKQRQRPIGLQTSGEFGLLGTVLEDAVQTKLSWSRWEISGGVPLAVYRYTVPAGSSHYQVGSSWLRGAKGQRVVFQQFSGYRGEIAIDPSAGTILRLMLIADAKPADRMAKANIVVEYGPIVLDGKTYVCPVRSVALSLAADTQVYSTLNQPAPRFLQTSLNDVTFERYHLFHADARIVSATPEY
jgi:hypothetical protein